MIASNRSGREAGKFLVAAGAAISLALAAAPVAAQNDSARETTGSGGRAAAARADEPTRLLREPTVNATAIAFSYAEDIWIVPRAGGVARRLTSFQGEESEPHFSPDGRTIAFTGEYDGNTDVYIIPVEGGQPQRLTWHPGADVVQGWTPDGARVVFSSSRTNAPSGQKFWSVSTDGDFPQALPMPRANQGTYSPDGARFAYRMVTPWEDQFRNYRGGQNRPIWILDMDDYDLEKVEPWNGSDERDPVWLGNTVYFLSDRDYAMNVYAYDTGSKQLRQITHFVDFDAQNLDAGGGVIAIEQGGYIHLYDPATDQTTRIDITVRGDMAWVRPHWETVSPMLTNPSLSPTGKRAVFEARGEVITVPADEGDWRNLSTSTGAADRRPVWSPDGKSIAWFSDESDEYQLVISDQDGINKRSIALDKPTFYFTPVWSPDSKRIAFTDAAMNLWYVDVASGKQVHVDTDNYMHPDRTLEPVWSPDSRWIAYAKRLDNQYHVVMVYGVEDGSLHQITDGMSDVISPAWDAGGKYMYFLASTNFALNTGWLDMSSYERPVTRAVYLAVLSADEKSPLLPRSDEEAAAPDSSATKTQRAGAGEKSANGAPQKPPPTVSIDFDGIGQRILSIGVPERDYAGLIAGAEGTIFYAENVPNERGVTLHRWVMKDREAKPFMTGVSFYTVSADGKKLLYGAGGGGGFGGGNGNGATWGIVDTDKTPPKVGDGRLATNDISVKVDPEVEYKQMFDEGWRIQRDFLYVRNMHGADWDSVYALYSPWVSDVAYRSDLTYLLDMMGAEVSIGHSFVRGGDLPDVDRVPIGLLGADLEIADGRYRIAHIYTGENWNPELRAPLSAPGIDVNEGDYILEVNGNELRAPASPYRLFEGTANRQTFLRVNSRPTLDGSRVVTVVPVANEGALRTRAWVEANRRKVDELSGGKLAYVWLPNTGQGGYTAFNRYYFAQQDKRGAIIDERFNSGGSAADYMIDVMSRELHGFFNNAVADHRPFTSPGAGIWGPKVMIINERAGSGGDLLPYMFKEMKIGPLVGMRTWGGLVGTWDSPPLMDGGSMIAPRGGFYNTDGEWDVENKGVAPDVEVDYTPKEVLAGHDPQLEKAVEVALQLLEETPVAIKPEPPPPDKWRRPGDGKGKN